MKTITEFYNELLGIDSRWEVKNVETDLENFEVIISLSYTSKIGLCPECQKECFVYDYRELRKWRHLDTCQMKTYIVANVPRIKYKEHNIKTVDVPWANSNSHFTKLFEKYSINLLSATVNQKKVSDILRISFSQIHTIMEKAVARGLFRRESKELEYIGIDEKSMKKGHHYLTVVSDLKNNCVIDVVEDRKTESVKTILTSIKSTNNTDNLKAVTMDMWKPFMKVCGDVFPKSDIIHDRFHLSKYLNDAVDKTRRKEVTKLDKANDKRLKKTKYLFLKNEENMTSAQSIRFKEIKEMSFDTCKAWSIKETFKGLFKNNNFKDTVIFFNDWLKDVSKSGLKYMIEIAEMFDRHRIGIINYVEHKITNSLAENLNGKIQLLKFISRGFKSYKNFRIAILFHYGKLDLLP